MFGFPGATQRAHGGGLARRHGADQDVEHATGCGDAGHGIGLVVAEYRPIRVRFAGGLLDCLQRHRWSGEVIGALQEPVLGPWRRTRSSLSAGIPSSRPADRTPTERQPGLVGSIGAMRVGRHRRPSRRSFPGPARWRIANPSSTGTPPLRGFSGAKSNASPRRSPPRGCRNRRSHRVAHRRRGAVAAARCW